MSESSDCRLACPCAVYQDFRNPLKDYQMGYYDVIKDIVDRGHFEKDDFTVVLQPFLMDMKPLRLVKMFPFFLSLCICPSCFQRAKKQLISLKPDTDLVDFGFFAVDCFHPSWRGHRILAFKLWETMVSEVHFCC